MWTWFILNPSKSISSTGILRNLRSTALGKAPFPGFLPFSPADSLRPPRFCLNRLLYIEAVLHDDTVGSGHNACRRHALKTWEGTNGKSPLSPQKHQQIWGCLSVSRQHSSMKSLRPCTCPITILTWRVFGSSSFTPHQLWLDVIICLCIIVSGQISIIPKPELRGFGGIPLLNHNLRWPRLTSL